MHGNTGMQKLTERECIEKIQNCERFQAEIAGGFRIKIEKYTFYVCTAIHDGHNLREDLRDNCLLDESERLYEEDPHTGALIDDMPITLTGLDSRYEYDLNRCEENCVYETAWGKDVWKQPLTDAQKNESLAKHRRFYRVALALARKLQHIHGSCLFYDMHSYNYKRRENEDTPDFNVGTEQLDKQRWGSVIRHWHECLDKIEMPGMTMRAAVDEVFYGRGNQATVMKPCADNILVLPTELKKIFMDELTGELHEAFFNQLKRHFHVALLQNALYFTEHERPDFRENPAKYQAML
jgi:hypothetical protein